MNKLLVFFALCIFLIFGFLFFLFMATPKDLPSNNTVVVVDSSPKLISRITLVCNVGATIDASFYERAATTTPLTGQPPVPTGSVKLALSDGRTFNLPQTISADGGRYANTGEMFVFWSKGNGALILENGAEKKYRGCVRVADVGAEVKLPSVFADKEGTFSLRLPGIFSSTTSGYQIAEQFAYVLTPKKSIEGVQFTIPVSMATGTNLSRDSYLSVENIKDTTTCTADKFLDGVTHTTVSEENGVTYSIATSSEAAAGNRYEETVYALQGTSPCIAVREFIHYGVFENYASGTVKAFNKASILGAFDQIRKTLVVNQ